MNDRIFSHRWKLLFGSLVILNFVCAGTSIDLSIPALGRPAFLGEFYDARNQSFLGVTIFRDDIPREKLIKSIDTTQSDIKYGIVDSSKSKVFHLDVSAEIKVEMMSGKLEVSGSAAYFNEEKKSALEVEGFLIYKTRTRREVLNLLYDHMKQYLNLESLGKVGATHIVIGVEWGGDVIIKFLNKVENEEEDTKIDGSLKLSLALEKLSIGASATANLTENSDDVFSNFSLNVYGDISLGSNMPQNTKDVVTLINKVPEKLKENNNGKGVPMSYTLFPISTLSELMGAEKLQQKIVNDLDEAILNDFVKMFEKILTVQQQLNDLEAKVKYYSNCTSEKDVDKIETLNSKFSDAALHFKIQAREAMYNARVATTTMETVESHGESPGESLQTTTATVSEEYGEEVIVDEAPATKAEDYTQYDSIIQSGDPDRVEGEIRVTRSVSTSSTLTSVLNQYAEQEFSVGNVSSILNSQFNEVLKKIELYQIFKTTGISYIGRFGAFQNFRLQVQDQMIFALFMMSWTDLAWESNWHLFVQVLKSPFSVLVIVDCSFNDPSCESVQKSGNKSVIHQYFRSQLVSSDVYNDLKTRSGSISNPPPLVVSALGRHARLGSLYNSKSHQFTEKSIFLTGTEQHKINVKYEVFDNETIKIVRNGFQEKFQVMEIQPPALQYNILLNPKGFQGVGRTFLETRGFQPQWVSSTVYHVYNTILESLAGDDFWKFVSISQLLKGGATHFVKQVVWGGQTTITLSAPLPDQNNISSSITGSTSHTTDLPQKVHDDLTKISKILASKSNNKLGEEPTKILKIQLHHLNYEILFASDIFQNARNEFRTERDLVDFLNEFPRLKLDVKEGRGYPVQYILHPIESLPDYFGEIPYIPSSSNALQNASLAKEFTQIFEMFFVADEKIKKMKRIFDNNRVYVTDDTVDNFKSVVSIFRRIKMKAEQHVQDFFTKNESEIQTWTNSFENSANQNSTNNVFFSFSEEVLNFDALDQFNSVVQKIGIIQELSKYFPQLYHAGKAETFHHKLKTFDADSFVYVLFLVSGIYTQNDSTWVDNVDLLKHHLSGKPYTKLILVDCDFEDESCKIIEKSTIHVYRNNQIISDNLLEGWNAAVDHLNNNHFSVHRRESLGRNIREGALYDIRREKLLDHNILNFQKMKNYKCEDLFLTVSDLEKIEVNSIGSSDLTQRYYMLEMDPEVQLAFLFQGQEQNLEGSGKFLDENLEFSNAVKFTVHHHISALNINAKCLPLLVQPIVGKIEGATHFVKEIVYGSNSIFTLGESGGDDVIQYLGKTFGSLLQDGTQNLNVSELQRFDDFKVFTDLSVDGEVKVINGGKFIDTVQQISLQSKYFELPQKVTEKTPSISFILEPLASLQRPLGILTHTYKYQSLPDKFQVSPVVEKYQAFRRALNETRTLKTELLSPAFKIGMSNSSLEKIEEIHHHLFDSFTKFKIQFRDELEAIKNGSRMESGDSESKLKEIVDLFKDIFTVDGKYSRLEELEPEREKIKFLKYITDQSSSQNHITYLGRDRNFNDVVFSSAPTKYVLYFKNLINLANNPLWLNSTTVFFKLAGQGKKCFVIDCEFPAFNCSELAKPAIHQYQDGVLTTPDYAGAVEIQKKETEMEMTRQLRMIERLQNRVASLDMSYERIQSNIG